MDIKNISLQTNRPYRYDIGQQKQCMAFFRRHLKKVFLSDICVEPSSQVLDILEYACPRSRFQTRWLFFACLPSSPEGYAGQMISNKNPNFELPSTNLAFFFEFVIDIYKSTICYSKTSIDGF